MKPPIAPLVAAAALLAVPGAGAVTLAPTPAGTT